MSAAVLAFWGGCAGALGAVAITILMSLGSGDPYTYGDFLENSISGGLVVAWLLWSKEKQLNGFLAAIVAVCGSAISSAAVPAFLNFISGEAHIYEEFLENAIGGGIGGIVAWVTVTIIWRAWLSNKRQTNSHPPY